MNTETNLDAVFSALSDPTRRRMIERLSRRSLTVGELAAEFPISQPAISKHVRILEDSGLVRREILGREHHLTIATDGIESASDWIERQRKFWNATLDRLEQLFAKQPKGKKK